MNSPKQLHHQISISDPPPQTTSSSHQQRPRRTSSSHSSCTPEQPHLENQLPYSDHSPRINMNINHLNQLDQDVQAAIHFSRARAGTLNLSNSSQSPPLTHLHHHHHHHHQQQQQQEQQQQQQQQQHEIHPHHPSQFHSSSHDSSCLTSPRPSHAEEDVCFPRLETDRPMLNQRLSNMGDPALLSNPPQSTTAGMLPHFPYPFNFQALEEFAQAERQTLDMMKKRRLAEDPYRRGSALLTPGPRLDTRIGRSNEIDDLLSPEEDQNALAEDPTSAKDGVRRRKIGFLPQSSLHHDSISGDLRQPSIGVSGEADGEEGVGGGRMSIFNQRRLSENLRPISPTKRKLALFEGMGGNLLSGFNISSQTEGSAISGGPLKGNPDGRATLLGSRPTHFPFPGSHSSQDQRTGQVRWVNNAERPYRFSFYSNALPSTIHARSLAEIPGEGQTFEDLFIGRRSTSNSSTHVGDDSAPRRTDPHVVSEHLDIPAPNITTQQEPLYTSSPGQVSNAFSSSIPKQHDFGVLTDAQIASAEGPLHHNSSSLQLPQQQGDGNKNQKPKSGALLRTDEDAEASTWWLDVLSPTDQEMKLLSKVFGIHPLTTEDIQMEETREKIELFRNYYLVCFRSFDQDPYSPTFLEPLNIYIIVFREGTLSFHFRATPHPQNVRRRIKQLKDYINVTSDWVSYALIDDITDAFGPLIQSIEYEVDSIDELVLILKDVEQSDMLRRIGTCRKKVMGLLRLMGNKADVVKGLAKRCNENWLIAPKSDIGLYLSDIQDHLVTMTQNLNHYEKILSRSHSNYLAQISIEMTDANNQINDVLSKLTALGSILVPMNLVTGLWGMNVHVPGQDITEGYAWFIAIVSGLVSFGIIGAWLTLRYLKFSNR